MLREKEEEEKEKERERGRNLADFGSKPENSKFAEQRVFEFRELFVFEFARRDFV